MKIEKQFVEFCKKNKPGWASTLGMYQVKDCPENGLCIMIPTSEPEKLAKSLPKSFNLQDGKEIPIKTQHLTEFVL